MRQLVKWCFAVAVAAAVGFAAVPAWAKEERTPVGNISLSITSDIEAGESGGDVSVDVDSGECGVELVEIMNEKDIWAGGDEPKIRIELGADSDYYFKKASKSTFSFSGDHVKYVSSSIKNDRETLVLVVRLEELDDANLSVGGLDWDADTGVASWDETSGAKCYRVRLRRDDYDVGQVYTTTETSYDFSALLNRRGAYYFKVRAVDYADNGGDWEESGNLYIDADDLMGGADSGKDGAGAASVQDRADGGVWVKDNIGWWYRNGDQTFPRNCWQYIKNAWYFFDNQGYMMTGWIMWNGKMYYCDPESGAMWANRTALDGSYLGGDGARTN